MQNNNFQEEAKLTLSIIKNVIGDKESFSMGKNLDKINWPLFKRLVSYHEIVSFFYLNFNTSPYVLPKEIVEFSRNAYYVFFLRDLYLQEEFLKLNRMFMGENLILVPIKGLAFLFGIYRHIPVRPMVDIDVLVKEEELGKIMALLVKSGYRQDSEWGSYSYWRNKNCNIPFKKTQVKKPQGECDLELHFALDIKRSNVDILPDLWKRLRSINVNGDEIMLLSPEDDFFSLVLHRRRYGRTLSLKNICDGALILESSGNNFNWDYILKESRKGKMCSAVFFFLTQLKLLLDVNVPQEIWKALDVPAWKKKFISHLIQKGTFSDMHYAAGTRRVYLKSHFLLYDNLWEPLNYVINLPQEQFAKFYEFKPYDKYVRWVYHIRFVYIIYKEVSRLFKIRKLKNS